MTYMMESFGVLMTFLVLFAGTFTSGQKHDTGYLPNNDVGRERRSADGGPGTAQLPQQQNPFMMSSNIQASYFLGQCVMCPPGDPGPRGVQGPQGMPGRDGRDQLIIGPLGEQTIQDQPSNTPGEGPNTRSAGVTYTRWGKTTCPSTSQLVYEGIMGGSNNYVQKGSAVNYLCLPLRPTFGDPPNSAGGGAYIFGVEYENEVPTSPGLYQSEAPCVVCLAPSRGTVVVVPGSNTCLGDQDWTLEYTGYMMSSHYTYYKSDIVCIDQNAEGISRTNANNNENIIYLAEVKCGASGGGLPCPPYVDGHDLICAVCTL